VVREGRALDRRTLALFYATKGLEPEEAVRLAEQERTIRDDLYTEDAYAWALYRAGRLEEARAAVDRATALGTPDARLRYHAGAIRLASGERRAGRALIRAALALNPAFDLTGAAEARRAVPSRRAAASVAR
jgi:Flp pilus assembly protein TadD